MAGKIKMADKKIKTLTLTFRTVRGFAACNPIHSRNQTVRIQVMMLRYLP